VLLSVEAAIKKRTKLVITQRKTVLRRMRVTLATLLSPKLTMFAFLLPAWPSIAQVLLVDNDSTVALDPYSQRGMYGWTVDGQNQLQQEWFWYGLGNGAVQSLDTISSTPTVVQTGSRELTATYLSSGSFSVSVDYLLTGGTSGGGQGSADLSETIKIINLSSAPLSYHFYEYSYFNLQTASRDIVQLGTNLRGQYDEALQYNSGSSLTETVTTPGADHGEVAPLGLTLARLDNGSAVTLGSPFGAGPVGPGAVTWALEWDLNILPGDSAIISKDKYLNVVVPEPSLLALMVLGLLVLVFGRGRKFCLQTGCVWVRIDWMTRSPHWRTGFSGR
jgi:hypothetical protein